MRKQSKPWLFVLGPAALIAGTVIRAFFVDADNTTGHFPNISLMLLGFGSSLTAVGIVYFIITKWLKIKNPKKAKQIEIEAKDERNVKLLEKSGYTTWYITMITLLVLTMTLMILGSMTAFWLSLGAFVIHISAFFLCGFIYDKKM